MPEPKRKPREKVESDLNLEGFEKFFDGSEEKAASEPTEVTVIGESSFERQIEKLTSRFGELITLAVDHRVETAKIANQLIENQRQLIATQQILIRLMERSIELTRHITGIEEKLPAVFELPRLVENLRVRIAQLEGVETN